jgi:hypothetical protein
MLQSAQVFAAAVLVAAAGFSAVFSAQRPAAAITIQRVEARPRLFFAPGEFRRFVAESTGPRADFFNSLVTEVQSRGTRDWNERNLQIESQALVARVLLERGDARGGPILDLARNSLRYYMDRHTYTEWRDSHQMVTGGSRWLEAVSLAYDWAYPNWTSAERTAMADWLRDEINHWVDDDQITRASPSPFRNDLARGVAGLVGAGLVLFDEPGYREAADKALRYALSFYDEVLAAHQYAGADGGMAEGTFYGSFTAWSQVMVAEMLYTGAGIRDIYRRTPFFENRLRYVIHAAWPGYITNQFRFNTHQLAPIFGDARRGPTGSTLQHRATVLLLGKRLPGEAARHAYAIVNRDETSRTYTREWRLYDLLFWSPGVSRERPGELAYRERTLGQVFARSSWNDDATWISFNAGPHLDTHQHYDAGNLTIYRNGADLLVDSGSLDAFGTKHWYNYYVRTVGHNTILIHDPEERWEAIWGGVPDDLAVNDGGQRTAAPLTPAPTLRQYLGNRVAYDHGSIDRYAAGDWGIYLKSNLTNAYQNPRYQSNKPNRTRNRVKAQHVGREVLYLRRGEGRRDAVVVFDRIVAADPSFKKAVLWHAREPFSTSIPGRRVDEGERVYETSSPLTFQTTATFSQGDNEGSSRLYVSVVPVDKLRVRHIGQRPSTGEQPDHETFNTKHYHRHVKDYFVEDPRVTNPDTTTGATNRQEWPPIAPAEVQWLWRDDLAGGWGSTRLQVEPATGDVADRLLTLLVPTDAGDGDQPRVQALGSPDRRATGLAWSEGGRQFVFVFGLENSGGDLRDAVVEVPVGAGELFVLGLSPETGYQVTASGGNPRRLTIAPGGTLASGSNGLLRLDLESLRPLSTGGAAARLAPGAPADRPAGPEATSEASILTEGAQSTVISAVTPPSLAKWQGWLEQRIDEGRLTLRHRVTDPLAPGRVVERFDQRLDGLPVFGHDVVAERIGDRVTAVFGVVSDSRVDRAGVDLTADQARRAIERAAGIELPRTRKPLLTVAPRGDGTAARAYCDRVMTHDGPRTMCVDAASGSLLASVDEARTQAGQRDTPAARVYQVEDADSIVGYVNGLVSLSSRELAGTEPGSPGEAIGRHQAELVARWSSQYGVGDLLGRQPVVSIVRFEAERMPDAEYVGRGVMLFIQGRNSRPPDRSHVAHELAHVLIDRSSRLRIDGESGELEEGFAQLMAELAGPTSPTAGSGVMRGWFHSAATALPQDRLRIERAFVRAFTRLLPSAATRDLARAAIVTAYEGLGGAGDALRRALRD